MKSSHLSLPWLVLMKPNQTPMYAFLFSPASPSWAPLPLIPPFSPIGSPVGVETIRVHQAEFVERLQIMNAARAAQVVAVSAR